MTLTLCVDRRSQERNGRVLRNRQLVPTHDLSLVVDLQNKALQHIKPQDPDLPVPRLAMSVNGRPVETMSGAGGEPLMIRVMTYLSGETLWNVPRTPELLREVGAASDLATTKSPEVSLSIRCTIPGRFTPPTPDRSSPQ